jgi:hypothetical protein
MNIQTLRQQCPSRIPKHISECTAVMSSHGTSIVLVKAIFYSLYLDSRAVVFGFNPHVLRSHRFMSELG